MLCTWKNSPQWGVATSMHLTQTNRKDNKNRLKKLSSNQTRRSKETIGRARKPLNKTKKKPKTKRGRSYLLRYVIRCPGLDIKVNVRRELLKDAAIRAIDGFHRLNLPLYFFRHDEERREEKGNLKQQKDPFQLLWNIEVGVRSTSSEIPSPRSCL